jgi:serine protease Do
MRSRHRACLFSAAAIALMVCGVSAAAARQYSWLGVRIRDLSEQEMDDIANRHGIREGFGVFVVDVMERTPAADAGMKGGDVIVAFGDRPVVDTRALQRLVAAASPDTGVQITVLRSEGRRALRVRLAAMPRDIVGDRVAAEFGFMMRDADSLRVPGAPADPAAPSVALVIRDGAAEKAGLEVGDVIVQVNERAVSGRDVVREALSDLPPEAPLRLVVRRGEQVVSLTLAVP